MAICAKCGKEIEGKSWFADNELFQSSKVYHEECAPVPEEEKEKIKKLIKMQEDMKAGKVSKMDVLRLIEDIEGSGAGSEEEMAELQKLLDLQNRMKSQTGKVLEEKIETVKALAETEEERRELEKLSRMKKEIPKNNCYVCGAEASNSINGNFYCSKHSAGTLGKAATIKILEEEARRQNEALQRGMKEAEERRRKELEEARRLEEQRQRERIKLEDEQRKREESENKRKLEEARRLEEARKEMQRKFQAELEAARRRDEEAGRKREIEAARKVQIAMPSIPEFIPPDRFTGACPYCSHKLKLISKIGGEEEYECTNPNC